MSARGGAAIRQQLGHPVVDADGHWIEAFPVFCAYLAETEGSAMLARLRAGFGRYPRRWHAASAQERQRARMRRPAWWGFPTDTLERAAAMAPALYRAQLDNWGIDLALVYPTMGFVLPREIPDDPELLRACVRAYNCMVADLFAPHRDRIIAAGFVPLDDPGFALEALDHAAGLGLRLICVNGPVLRSVPADADLPPGQVRRVFIDGLALDSPHDYDPVWRKFAALKLAVTVHGGSNGWPDRTSPSNYVACHLGHFAQSHHLFARSLFLGGVTQRFPQLHFGFLEGGVGWACNLASDLAGHWKKRNQAYMRARLDPANVDQAELARLLAEHAAGNRHIAAHAGEIARAYLEPLEPGLTQAELSARDRDADDFARLELASADDVARQFAGNFYFGCEADDPMVAVAFDRRFGTRLKPMLGSDISHFDVEHADAVLGEAWELVEHGMITEADFRDFTFGHVVQLHGGMDPDFFRGTVVQSAARAHIAGSGEDHAAA